MSATVQGTPEAVRISPDAWPLLVDKGIKQFEIFDVRVSERSLGGGVPPAYQEDRKPAVIQESRPKAPSMMSKLRRLF